MNASAVQVVSGYDAAAAVAAINMTTEQEQELLEVQGLALSHPPTTPLARRLTCRPVYCSLRVEGP